MGLVPVCHCNHVHHYYSGYVLHFKVENLPRSVAFYLQINSKLSFYYLVSRWGFLIWENTYNCIWVLISFNSRSIKLVDSLTYCRDFYCRITNMLRQIGKSVNSIFNQKKNYWSIDHRVIALTILDKAVLVSGGKLQVEC